jgi:hypothetical protein
MESEGLWEEQDFYFCHSERSEESLSGFSQETERFLASLGMTKSQVSNSRRYPRYAMLRPFPTGTVVCWKSERLEINFRYPAISSGCE